MISLFQKVQVKRKRVTLVSECNKPKLKKPKKIAHSRFLIRSIFFKLKDKQLISINNSLAFFIALSFNQTKSKNITKQKKAINTVTSICIYIPRIKDQKKRYYLTSFKEPNIRNSINNKHILQKQITYISTLFKIKSCFSILEKHTNLLLKNNVYLIKSGQPYTGLTSYSTIGGFKKVLFNKALVYDRRLKPSYNRRKHNITHSIVVKNQLARLDKTFLYVGKNKLSSMIALVLKAAYYRIPMRDPLTTKINSNCNNKKLVRVKAIPYLVSIIEGQFSQLIWRNQFNSLLTKSRQNYRQDVFFLSCVFKNMNVVLFKN